MNDNERTEAAAAETPTTSAPRARPKRRWRLPFSTVEVLGFLLAVNMIATAGLAIRLYRGDKPTVMTVGITQMTREYMAKLATTSGLSPQEASIRTRLYLAVAQDAVRSAATQKGVLVLPRECVLAGEYADLTPDVTKAVNATLDEKLRAVPAAPIPPAEAPGPQALLEESNALR